jgi:hypothetical protein
MRTCARLSDMKYLFVINHDILFLWDERRRGVYLYSGVLYYDVYAEER